MGYAPHIIIPDMGSDPPIDVIFNDDIKLKEIIRAYDDWGNKEFVIECSCKTWAGTAKYIAALCEYVTLNGERVWEFDHGRVKAGVFYKRARYPWIRLEISENAAKIMNDAFKKSKFIGR